MMRELKDKKLLKILTSPNHAAAQIPMMRELKDIKLPQTNTLQSCCSPNPYDEGTERKSAATVSKISISCSPNPYDEGTESCYHTDATNEEYSCSPNPYDEGTESQINPP